jgi:hypothetical protein
LEGVLPDIEWKNKRESGVRLKMMEQFQLLKVYYRIARLVIWGRSSQRPGDD